jgi:hypothetical protein
MELSESDAHILFSPVTTAELCAGARLSEYRKLEALFDALVCVPADASVGRKEGEYLRHYRKSHSVELGAVLIAASTVASGGHLWDTESKALCDAGAYLLRMKRRPTGTDFNYSRSSRLWVNFPDCSSFGSYSETIERTPNCPLLRMRGRVVIHWDH